MSALFSAGIHHAAREFHERFAARMRRLRDHDRHAAVARLAHLGIDRDSREQIRALALRHPLAAAIAKYFVALATVGTYEVAHVLDHSENRTMHLAEHLDRASRVEQRDVLRGGDDHR